MTREVDVLAAARVVLERDGAGALTMHRVAAEMGIKAPSLYKHVAGKAAIQAGLVAAGLTEIGNVLHAAVAGRTAVDPAVPGRTAIEPAVAGRTAIVRAVAGGTGIDPAAVGGDGHGAGAPDGLPVVRLLAAYRRYALTHPELYRLATAGPLPRDHLPEGLEAWAGEPFLLVTGDPHRAQALWSLAHGMVVLELDDRYPAGNDLDRTWSEAAAAFTPAGVEVG